MDHDRVPRWLLLATAGWIIYCVIRPDFFLSVLREDGGPFLIVGATLTGIGLGWLRDRRQIARERRETRAATRAAYETYCERRAPYRASQDG